MVALPPEEENSFIVNLSSSPKTPHLPPEPLLERLASGKCVILAPRAPLPSVAAAAAAARHASAHARNLGHLCTISPLAQTSSLFTFARMGFIYLCITAVIYSDQAEKRG